jgi:beta-barrel assembly-enhancing protease
MHFKAGARLGGMRVALAFLSLVVLAAADPALLALQRADGRVLAIAYRLSVASAQICPNRAPQVGLRVHDAAQYGGASRAAAAATFGLHADLPSILAVAPESPAERAGLRPGDVVTAIAGRPLDASPPGSGYAGIAAFDRRLTEALRAPPAQIDILRGGAPARVALTGEAGCLTNVTIVPGRKLEANANGNEVNISDRLVAFARNDDELAIAIAHEMAHNALGHPARVRASGRKRDVIRATEEEADRFAFYMAARAGYDLRAGAAFLTRFSKKTDWGILSDGTHPGWKARRDNALAVIAAIERARAQGRPLDPALVE